MSHIIKEVKKYSMIIFKFLLINKILSINYTMDDINVTVFAQAKVLVYKAID